jgi:hypothetical protein
MIETFDQSVLRFGGFLERQGWPSRLTWIVPGNARVVERKVLIRRTGKDALIARSQFEAGIRRGLGIALQAVCRLEDSAGCFVFVPQDRIQAEHCMVHEDNLKMSVLLKPDTASPVENRLRWWFLKKRGVDYWEHYQSSFS